MVQPVSVETGRSEQVVSPRGQACGGPGIADIPGPPRRRQSGSDAPETVTITVQLTSAELDGLAWSAILVTAVGGREAAAERTLLKVRAQAKRLAPKRAPYW